MKEKSIKINFLYNMIFTCLNLLFPLITAPYVSRVLGADNLGKVNFATSFVNWFVIISSFGTITYGLRETAKIKYDKEKLSILFSELLIIKIITTFIVSLIYIIIIFSIPKFYLELKLYLIFFINIILNIFSIDWFYQGIEDYKYITLRSAIFKLISFIAMIIFVKNKENYIIYSAITIFALSFSNILNYFYSKNFVSLKFKNINIIKHLKKLFVFFLSSLIVSCYTMLDQVLLGIMVDNTSVAFLNRGRQIVTIGLSITLSLSTVIMPKSTYYYTNDKEKYYELIESSINYIYILSFPCMIGTIFLSKEIMLLLGGETFLESYKMLRIVSLNILIGSLGNWNYNQVILPTGNENISVVTQIIMALISITFNLILIYKLGYIGSGISWVLAESIGTLINITFTKKKLHYKIFTIEFFKYIIAVFFMAIAILAIKSIISNYILILILNLIFCPIIYFIVLLIIKEKITINIYSLLKNKL